MKNSGGNTKPFHEPLSPESAVDAGNAAQHLPPATLDELDWKILFQLSPDARKPFLAIAGELGVDEKTIRNRASKLREAGVLQFAVLLSPNRVKQCVVMHIGVRLKAEAKSQRAQAAEKIARHSCINWVNVILGPYDLLAEAAFTSFEEMKNFEFNELPQLSLIESAECFLALSHHGTAGVVLSEAQAAKNL